MFARAPVDALRHRFVGNSFREEPVMRSLPTALLRHALLCLVLSFGALACTAGAEPPPVTNTLSMTLTEKGFEPQNLSVKKGEPVKLTITRKTNSTCATEIVLDEYNINVKLPLDTPTVVTFTPTKSGQLKYGCAMKKMIGGVITVI
jgi:plastocyanin